MKTIRQHLNEQDPGHGKAISRGVRRNWEKRKLRQLRAEIKLIDWEHPDTGENHEILSQTPDTTDKHRHQKA